VKPLSEDGGVGVHAIVERDGGFVDLFDKEKFYPTRQSLGGRFASLLQQKKVRVDEWIVEELILPPSGRLEDSRDLKFFAFYGDVGCVLQVDRWSKKDPVRGIFDRDGQLMNVSKFYSIPKEPFPPAFTDDDIAYVSAISRDLPWPGVRIDFLNGKDGLVFGEFTLNPGAYGGFYDAVDQHLGDLWAKAAGVMYDDMLQGRTFDTYCNFLEEFGSQIDPFHGPPA
jgi:hypothetical protein